MLIRDRPEAGPWLGLALSVAFAAVMLPLATLDLWLSDTTDSSGRAVFSVRLPLTGIYRDTLVGARFEYRRVVVARGERMDDADRRLARAYERGRRPPSMGLQLGLGLAYLLLGLLFTSYLRRFGYRGRHLRTQLVLLAAVAAIAALARVFLLWTPFPAYWIPLGAISLAIAVHHDRQLAFPTTVAAALVLATLTPFDLPLAFVLLAQGFGAVLGLGRSRRPRALIGAGLLGGTLASAAYVTMSFLVRGHLVPEDLASPLGSALLSAAGGGLLAGVGAIGVAPLLERALGQVPRSRLMELTDLNHPLLRKIAQEAPGTWAHSLAMANMAELAATAIGCNALLTRVGAYFHDLGKTVQPRYYIENLKGGETSPHDQLDPDLSAEAIFAHCTHGVRMGGEAGIPQPVLDFMHMHHGNGLLEYFWHKNQELGNPKQLSERDFRYPGLPPQTKETAILAICDAVEAASRTLKTPKERDLQNLVQRIVFGKLRLGQLDDSGLTSSDLKLLCNSLVDTLKNSFHDRIEYPWQKEERAALSAEAAEKASSGPQVQEPVSIEASQRIPLEDRLDSADAPRPPGQAAAGRERD